MDIRTQYTQKVLKESIVDLLGKERLHEITIKQLCAAAGVNKSTLYAHYKDIYDLYYDAENDFIKRILECSQSNSGSTSKQEKKQHYINVCNFYRDNKKYLIAFYKSGAGDDFVAKLGDSIANFVIAKNASILANIDNRKIKLIFGYSNQGYMYVIYNWLISYPEIPADEIAEILMDANRNTHLPSLIKILQ